MPALSHQEPSPRYEYGRTVADARALIAKSDTVLLAVRVNDHDMPTYLAVSPKAVAAALAEEGAARPMPCEWRPVVRELVIGSRDAIKFAMGKR